MNTRIITATLEVPEHCLVDLENFLNERFKLINYSIVPDTKELYETDNTFKKLVKAEKQAREEKFNYLNKVGY